LKTPYQHLTILAPVIIKEYIKDFDAQPGTAYAGIKMWATDMDEAVDMAESIGAQTGFVINGRIEIYKTDPVQPPGDEPYAYDINFSYYKE
jgi:hypothetical protein